MKRKEDKEGVGRQILQCVQGRKGNGGTGKQIRHSKDFSNSKDEKKAEKSVSSFGF